MGHSIWKNDIVYIEIIWMDEWMHVAYSKGNERSQRWNTFQISQRRNSNSDSSDLCSNSLPVRPTHIHTHARAHTHTHIYIYIYIYISAVSTNVLLSKVKNKQEQFCPLDEVNTLSSKSRDIDSLATFFSLCDTW